MYLPLHFLVLRAIILYHVMILVPSLLSLINTPHQLFACIKCMIQLMILALWAVASLKLPTLTDVPPNVKGK
jgi:hypothetical protein